MVLSLIKTIGTVIAEVLKLLPLWLANRLGKFKERNRNNEATIDAQENYRERRNASRSNPDSGLAGLIDRVRKSKGDGKR